MHLKCVKSLIELISETSISLLDRNYLPDLASILPNLIFSYVSTIQ